MNPKNKKAKKTELIKSRHLKILSMKKNDIKNSIVFVFFNEKSAKQLTEIMKVCHQLESIEPSATYILSPSLDFTVYEASDFKNKKILVTYQGKQEEQKIEKIFQSLGSKEVVVVKGSVSSFS